MFSFRPPLQILVVIYSLETGALKTWELPIDSSIYQRHLKAVSSTVVAGLWGREILLAPGGYWQTENHWQKVVISGQVHGPDSLVLLLRLLFLIPQKTVGCKKRAVASTSQEEKQRGERWLRNPLYGVLTPISTIAKPHSVLVNFVSDILTLKSFRFHLCENLGPLFLLGLNIYFIDVCVTVHILCMCINVFYICECVYA